MTTPSSFSRLVKIVAQEAFAKLEERKTYRIRVVPDKRESAAGYAVAAMRCENREEIHWLSVSGSTPAEVARLMRSGFEFPAGAAPVACEILQELLRNGQALAVDTPCAVAA